ncbi:hypothetical protein HDV05_006735 [Chytridiales sp. JEL 0842]|nr:hypothetical protein HDV05_006735 [Chytridiales sp. JEL 0842]
MPLSSLTTLLAFVLLTVSQTNAFPNGAPRCQINAQFISTRHRNQQTAAQLGAKITVDPPTYTPGGPPILVTIQANANFQGILAYANLPTDELTHAGSFDLASAKGSNGNKVNLKVQTANECTTRQVKQESLQSTFTHSATMNNGGKLSISWAPPKTDMGPLQFNAVVSMGSTNTPWAIVEPLKISPTGGVGGGVSGNGTSSAPPASGGAVPSGPSGTRQPATPSAEPARPPASQPTTRNPSTAGLPSRPPSPPSTTPTLSTNAPPQAGNTIPIGQQQGPPPATGSGPVMTVIAPANIRVVMMMANGGPAVPRLRAPGSSKDEILGRRYDD